MATGGFRDQRVAAVPGTIGESVVRAMYRNDLTGRQA
jgi:hypothetical protein